MSIRRRALDTPATWLGRDLRADSSWAHELCGEEVADLERALRGARSSGRSLRDLRRQDFPLGRLGDSITAWMNEMQRGRGFVNVRGIPVERYDPNDIATMYWGIGLHMGTAVSQNAAGDLLGHVRDTGADPNDTSVRLYKTRVELGFHSDGSDLVGLLCIRQGKSGGATRLVSTATVYNEVLRRRPDLIELLYEPFHWDRNDEQVAGEPPTFELPICRYENGSLTFFYIGWYIRKAQRHAHVPRLSAAQSDLLDLIDAIAADPDFHLEMRLEPGEINFLKNNTALHARTAFDDYAEPASKRHLIRLWLTARGDWADGDAFVRQGIPVKEGVRSDEEEIRAADDPTVIRDS